MSELKPCPFCGGEAKYMKSLNVPHSSYTYHWVKCYNPKCFAGTTISKDKREATDAWNTRANTDLQRQLYEQKAMVNELRGHLQYFITRVEEGTIKSVITHDKYAIALERIPAQSLAHIEVRVEGETVAEIKQMVQIKELFDESPEFMLGCSEFKDTLLIEIDDMHRKYQLPTNENQISSKQPENPSCFKKQLGVEACNHGCPVSDECYSG